jgi:hypothetical protein
MLDRLISGAGAVTDAADRSVRLLASGSRRDLLGTRPGSLVVAATLFVLAALLVLAGLEATDPTTPVRLSPADIEATRALPDRTYATISGSVDSYYVETFADDNGNGTEDRGESGVSWYYWLVDPLTRQGVTVRSTRSPSEVLTFEGRGIVRAPPDPGYLTEGFPGFGDELSEVRIMSSMLIDTSAGAAGPVTTVDLAGPLPSAGLSVEVSGSRLAGYVGVCTTDPNNNGQCDPGEEDRYQIVVFDPVSKHGVWVLVRDEPELVAAAMTGLLRREERTVDDARSAAGLSFGDLDVQVSDRYILDEPATAGSAPLTFALAATLAAVAIVLVIGLAGGYLIYRRSDGALPRAAATLAVGERAPLRITGLIRTPTGREHVRETQGELVRFVLGRAVSPPDEAPPAVPDQPSDVATEPTEGSEPPAEPPTQAGDPTEPTMVATTVLVERTGYPHGIALGRGELTELSAGRVMPLRGPRPAIRVGAGTGPVYLSFDSEADRDRAAAELLAEAGLAADGRQPETT